MKIRKPSEPGIHSPECEIWEVPSSEGVENLLAGAYEDESIARYLVDARPVYDAFSRILAQLSGVLLLTITSRRKQLALDHDMFRTAKEQLSEAVARLGAVHAPPSAQGHRGALEGIATHLSLATTTLDGLFAKAGESSRDAVLRDAVKRLHFAQRMIVAAAEPEANMMPVDLSHACCTCGGSSRATVTTA